MTPQFNLLFQKRSFSLSKKIFATAIAATLVTASAFASGDEANTKAINSLKKEYKNATNVEWKVTDLYTKASFSWNHQHLEVFYNKDGETIAESRAVDLNSIPLKAQQLLERKYADHTIAEAIEFNSEQDGLCYYVSVVKNNSKKILKITPEGSVSIYNP